MPLAEDAAKLSEMLGTGPDAPDDEINKAYSVMMAGWYTSSDDHTRQTLAELTRVYHRVTFQRYMAKHPNWFQSTAAKSLIERKKEERSPKSMFWNWKSFILAIIIAYIILIIVAGVTGTKPPKNIYWTVLWIYLSIEAWKYWSWKALLPYPLFVLLQIGAVSIMVSVGVENRLTHLIVLSAFNLGGLISFLMILWKAERSRK